MYEGVIKPEELHSLGKQILSVVVKCKPKVVRNKKRIKKILIAAAKAAKATIVRKSFVFMKDSNMISGLVVIAESHLTLNIYLETNNASIDVFTCGDTMIPEVAKNYIVSKIRGTIVQEFVNRPGKSGSYRPHKIETSLPSQDLPLVA